MTNWFDENGWLLKSIPKECVEECSNPGRNDEAVDFWFHEIEFYIPSNLVQKAKDYLAEYGAWEREELDKWGKTEDTEHELAKHVLWIFCGNIREGEEVFGLVH